MEGFSSLTYPLTNLNKKAAKFQLSFACKKSFQELMSKLITMPMLTLPDSVYAFVVYCDA